MKKIIVMFSMLLSFFVCGFAQQFETTVLYKRLPGQLYLEPVVGYTFGYPTNFQAGAEFGYKLDFGLTVSLSGIYRELYNGGIFQTSVDFGYQIWHFRYSYPYVSIGVGVLSGAPWDIHNMWFPTMDYRIGYNFVIVKDKLDLGLFYRGDLLFVKNVNAPVSTWLVHGLNFSFKWYISSPYNTKHW